MRTFDATVRVLGDFWFDGMLLAGSVPAARINSGTLSVARSWAYTGGDVTGAAGSAVLTISNNAVSNTKLADMAQATFKMRAAGAGTGDPIDGTAAQAKTALAIAYADVSGLGSMAQQANNNVNILGGFIAATAGFTSVRNSTPVYAENTNPAYTGDIYQAVGANATGAAYWAFRVYDWNPSPVAGWRGDGAVFAAVQCFAPVFVHGQANKGTVGAATTLTFSSGAFQTLTLTSATALTVTVGAPPGVGMVFIKITAPAAGTVPNITYPATFKGGWPVTVTNLGRYNLLCGFYDGTNYNYIGGSLNIA